MNEQRYTIAVLMSTYNGEKYLAEQIDSILKQREVDIKLFIRDDGSSDATKSIINKYCSKFSNIELIKESCNIGIGRSFIELLRYANDLDFYSYADQDDIWYEEKLISGISAIKDIEEPVLYCCNQDCCDEEGVILFKRFDKTYKGSGLICTVFNNYFAGCTMVFNKRLREMIVSDCYLPPMVFFDSRIHDAWTTCVAYATGKVIFDDKSCMRYRRHSYAYSNEYTPGKKQNSFEMLVRKIIHLKRNGLVKNSVKNTAIAILNSYKQYLSPEEIQELEVISEYDMHIKNKMSFICSDLFQNNVMGMKSATIIKTIMGIL